MSTIVEETSREAYESIIKSGIINQLQQNILKTIHTRSNNPMTASEIAWEMAVARDSVSPRLKPLTEMVVLLHAPKRKCRITGKSAKTYILSYKQPVAVERVKRQKCVTCGR